MDEHFTHTCDAMGGVPLAWATPGEHAGYVNLGDALSPMIVAALSGRPVVRAPFAGNHTRMAAVGTIGHGLAGGEIHVWGTGASPWLNPHAVPGERVPYRRPDNTLFHLHAARGPFSARQFGGDNCIHGDPALLLPMLHRPNLEKRWDLGVIPHLADLPSRDPDVPPAAMKLARRFTDMESAHHRIRLISTVTAPGTSSILARLNEILSCRRVLSASLHGVIIAEAYGIPCLYLGARGESGRVYRAQTIPTSGLDSRVTDYYAGIGESSFHYYVQSRESSSNWTHVIRAIDRTWRRKTGGAGELWRSFPLPVTISPVHEGASIFETVPNIETALI